jgi:hypothetical protein
MGDCAEYTLGFPNLTITSKSSVGSNSILENGVMGDNTLFRTYNQLILDPVF